MALGVTEKTELVRIITERLTQAVRDWKTEHASLLASTRRMAHNRVLNGETKAQFTRAKALRKKQDDLRKEIEQLEFGLIKKLDGNQYRSDRQQAIKEAIESRVEAATKKLLQSHPSPAAERYRELQRSLATVKEAVWIATSGRQVQPLIDQVNKLTGYQASKLERLAAGEEGDND